MAFAASAPQPKLRRGKQRNNTSETALRPRHSLHGALSLGARWTRNDSCGHPKENPAIFEPYRRGSGPPCIERPQVAAGATRPVSPSSPERCGLTHLQGDLSLKSASTSDSF